LKILVTGCCGFIGSNLVKLLCKQSFFVYGIDNFSDILYPRDKKYSNFESIRNEKNFKFLEMDLSSGIIDKEFKNVDFIVNLAALPGQSLSWKYTSDYMNHNFNTVVNLLKNYDESKVPGFLQISTSSVYGVDSKSTENTKCVPNNPYGVSKLAAENLLSAHHMYSPLDYKVFRLFSVYGPNQRPDMGIHKFLSQISAAQQIFIYGDGNQSRDFTYVEDVVTTIRNTIVNWGKVNSKIFNISGGQRYSVNELIEICEQVTKKKAIKTFVKTPIGDQLHTESISDLSLKELGHAPSRELKEGIEEQYKSMK
jgi:UDP-glucuronate 4-epimerase